MNLLLDSCTLIWLASEPERLSPQASAAIDDPVSVLHVRRSGMTGIFRIGAFDLSMPRFPRATNASSEIAAGTQIWEG